MTREKKLTRVRALCKKYKVIPYFTEKDMGYSHPWEGLIVLSNRWGYAFTIMAACHEIAHCLNYRNKKFYRFHSTPYHSNDYLRKMALRAEVYTDKVATKIWKDNGFTGSYIPTYGFDDGSRQYLKKYYNL